MELRVVIIGLATLLVGLNGFMAGKEVARGDSAWFRFLMILIWGAVVLINALVLSQE